MDTLWLEVLLIVVAMLANGYFSGAEIALVSARPARLQRLHAQGHRGARAALNLKETPDRFMATIQIAITLVGTFASAVGGAAAAESLTPWLIASGLPGAREWAPAMALALVILVITYVSLVIGELVPKALALRHPERVACLVARPILAFSRLSSGVVRALTFSTRVVLRAMGLTRAPESSAASEDEVRYMLRQGAATGVFERVEEELVANVFEFADTTVREIMVPRVNILALDVNTPPADILQRVADIGHTRIPVYRGSVERPVGVVVIKDVLRAAAAARMPSLADLMRPPLFVPEAARISVLLQELQRTGQNLAMVVDEYGGIVGLVTIEDVLEEVVGDIREEGERTRRDRFVRLADGGWVVDAATPVWEVGEVVGAPIPESPEYTTLAGFVLHQLQSVPRPGASFPHAGHRWTVVDVRGPRIVKVKIERDTTPARGEVA